MVAILENGIFYENEIKPTNMKYLILAATITTLWMAYEIWRAPLMEETDDGKLVTKRPTRKLSDLFKKRETRNSSSGNYSDLEKYGRGRSKY